MDTAWLGKKDERHVWAGEHRPQQGGASVSGHPEWFSPETKVNGAMITKKTLVYGHGVLPADRLNQVATFACIDELRYYTSATPLTHTQTWTEGENEESHQIRIRRAPRRIRQHLLLPYKRHLRVIIPKPLIRPIRQPPLVDEVVPKVRRRPAMDEHARELVHRTLVVPPDVL